MLHNPCIRHYELDPELSCSRPLPLPLPLAAPAAGLLPFKAGKSNAWLICTCPPVCGTAPVPGAHHNAPTHGWTFHPTDNVTFCRSAILPVISLIWYFCLWFRRRRTPGLAASEPAPFFESLFWLLFFCFCVCFDERFFVAEEKKRSRSASNEYGDSGAGMIVSQIIDSVTGVTDLISSSVGEEYDAST